MSTTVHSAPPFDVELGAVLAAIGENLPPTITPDLIGPLRQGGLGAPPISDLIGDRPIEHVERTVAGPDGAPDITLSIFRRTDHAGGGPGIYHTHGGGMIIGDRFTGADEFLSWVLEFDAVVVSVEYRLAPENPDPAPVDDCYAGLVWFAEHADELGVDPDRIVIGGASAGGGLAAGTALKARDLGGPAIAGQLLIYPMIDDRNETVSSHQIDGVGVWDRGSNDTGWNALLGDRRGTDDVSIYAAPARAKDLTGLPPAFIDVASAEVFRDEDVAYATRIWEQGGIAELHVWPGGFHGFDAMSPQATLSLQARAARVAWLHRLLGA
ncbi:alpha/beta hydrolase [Herbiconiux sp. CPCC 203407]|uniref:Alpha/beta hydrolase n=1 Tax=Herbiconiux oxytropis TaxID=2970915 RepID=A0AA41XHY6_9MICO|nr:alpha/beta hydrolase [Herbiconiux oxytropis]MCS5723626.1 alpha/beta hydrolase [Herbiconiux oxytropis]MCS5726943.1 alpha/beta hydrolase [Herbiconiux oxytropis]